MIKGDTAVFGIEFHDTIADETYALQSGDKAIFTLRRVLASSDEDSPIISRECDIVPASESSDDYGRCIITLVNGDTEDVRPGKYYWDVQLQTSTGIIQTVGPYRLTLKDHVTKGVISDV